MQDQRVIYNTLDLSNRVNDPLTAVAPFAYVAGGYLYIGQPVPFNNLWFEFGTLNSVASVPTIEQWWGQAWNAVVDLVDDTNSMRASGRVCWNTDRLKGWDIEQTSEDVSGLVSFKIYWKYWLRVSFSASFSAGTTLKFIGQRFSTDTDLFQKYPDMSNSQLMDAFESGKTNWDLQHFSAADEIARELRSRGVIKNKGQILNWELLKLASIHKVAEIAYNGLGRPYFDQKKEATKEYGKAINVNFYDIDKSCNGSLEPMERANSVTFGRR